MMSDDPTAGTGETLAGRLAATTDESLEALESGVVEIEPPWEAATDS